MLYNFENIVKFCKKFCILYKFVEFCKVCMVFRLARACVNARACVLACAPACERAFALSWGSESEPCALRLGLRPATQQ